MTDKPRYVYIAGPYTRGDTMHNIRQAIIAGSMVIAAGHYPYIPHLSGLWDLVAPRSYEDWMALDAAWLRKCDWLVALPGESPGVDREIVLAHQVGVAVLRLPEQAPLEELSRFLCTVDSAPGRAIL